MSKLDLEWLKVFDEIYQTASVSKAAERLGLAQAAASTALNKLRLHFDDRLFARTALGMQPTPHAQKIYPALREVLAQLEQARGSRTGFQPERARRRFRICLTDISEVVLLPQLLNHVRRAAPGVQIETEIVSNASARRLEDGEVDLAVGFMPQLEAGFYEQTLFRQNFVCLVARTIRASAPGSRARVLRPRRMRSSHLPAPAMPSSTRPSRATASSARWWCACRAFWAWRGSWRRPSWW